MITGWCNDQPGHPPALHYLCRHTYAGSHGQAYVCACPCHVQETKKVARRPVTVEKPAEAAVEAPAVHQVKRRPVRRV